MSKALLTALVATLAAGSFAPRLAAQDTTSANRRIHADTSGYTGAGGVDTTERPGRVGATDTLRLGADSGLVGDSAAVDDTSGMPGRRADDSTKAGQTDSPRSGVSSDSGAGMSDSTGAGMSDSSGAGMSDSSGMAQPSPQPSQNTSPSGATNPSSGTSP
jgi:hypothetical protein